MLIINWITCSKLQNNVYGEKIQCKSLHFIYLVQNNMRYTLYTFRPKKMKITTTSIKNWMIYINCTWIDIICTKCQYNLHFDFHRCFLCDTKYNFFLSECTTPFSISKFCNPINNIVLPTNVMQVYIFTTSTAYTYIRNL